MSQSNNNNPDIELLDGMKIDIRQVAQLDGSTHDPFVKTEPFVLGERILQHTKVFWPKKFATSTPKEVTSGFDMVSQKYFVGINFATQDYMSMCGNKDSIEAACNALKNFGTHSGNIPKNLGNNIYTQDCINAIEEYFHEVFGRAYAHIFSAGWLAGFGAIRGLVQPTDCIIMDELGHNCLKEGAKASQAKTIFHEHLDIDDLEKKIIAQRAADPHNSILVVTESLFSMDSDCPDLGRIQRLCKQHNATLLVDAAHDMFCTGHRGRGYASDFIKDFSNVVIIGSGSKSLSSNFGYMVCSNPDIIEMVKASCPSHLNSDVLPPAAAAHVAHNIRVMASQLGFEKREQLNKNSVYITEQLIKNGFECVGFPSPIVIVLIGSELMSRCIANTMYFHGVAVNSVEYPAVKTGESRLRLQIQANHTKEHLDQFVKSLNEVIPICQHYLETDRSALFVQDQLLKQILTDNEVNEKTQQGKL